MKKSAVEKNGVVWVTEEDNLSHEPSYYKLVSLHINDYRYFVYFPFDV
jgi:hypothetical protein